jgi:hypothetical protein
MKSIKTNPSSAKGENCNRGEIMHIELIKT